VAGGKKSEAGFVPRRAPDRSGLRSRFHCAAEAGEDGGHVAGGGRLRGMEKLGVSKPGTGVLCSARQ